MSDKYNDLIHTVQVKGALDDTSQACWQRARAAARSLASVTVSIQVFERVREEQPKEIFIIGDAKDKASDLEHGVRADDSDDACVVQRALFRRIGPNFGSPIAGRRIAGLLAVESRCSDPKREAEWHDWYNTVHVPDMLGSGLYHTAYRFEIVNRTDSRGHYLALYETDLNPATAHRSFWEEFRPKWIASGRVIGTMQVTSAASYAAAT
jgi:hypothetical protein